MKKLLVSCTLACMAISASAENPFAGTYLMHTTPDVGNAVSSVVKIISTDVENEVEVTGFIDAVAFKGTTLKATTDVDAGTLTFASGQKAVCYESPVTLSMLKESDDDYAAVEGSLVAKKNADGSFTFEGTWGFIGESLGDIQYVVTAAELVVPNATFSYNYRHSSGQTKKEDVPLRLSYQDNKLTVTGFSPEITDPLSDMVFLIDSENKKAILENPETPNSTGWTGDRYLCTITSFSGNFQNPGLKFNKGIECVINDGHTLEFPAMWGIVTLNPDEPNAEPAMTGIYNGGTLKCDFELCESSGMDVVGADDNSEAVYFDLSGRRLAHPAGLCIKLQNGKATKVIVLAVR